MTDDAYVIDDQLVLLVRTYLRSTIVLWCGPQQRTLST